MYYEFRICNIRSVLISIKIDACTNLDTKNMTRIILNLPVKKLCNILINIDWVFKRTYNRPGQPEEPEKPEIKPLAALFPKIANKVRVK